MRRFLMMLLLLLAALPSYGEGVEKGRIVKMLPLFLNSKGHDAVSPSLYDRDAYQAYLRRHPNEISAIRCDVLWQVADPAAANYKLRIELRGIGAGGKPTRSTLEAEVPPPLLRRWHSLVLGGADYKGFGELVAWRATLWRGDQLLSEQKSFLW